MAIGVAAGVVVSYALVPVAIRFIEKVDVPGPRPVLGAAIMLIGAAIPATLIPGIRASRVNVIHALRLD